MIAIFGTKQGITKNYSVLKTVYLNFASEAESSWKSRNKENTSLQRSRSNNQITKKIGRTLKTLMKSRPFFWQYLKSISNIKEKMKRDYKERTRKVYIV